ncbi:MAG: hypothetical protein ACHQD9_03925, partial [Chitinophagales bacterium]
MTKQWFSFSAAAAFTLIIFSAFIPAGISPVSEKPINADLLDKSIKPGDDFYDYVNAKWVKANPIPPTESRWGAFNVLNDNTKKSMREIMEDDAKANAPQGTMAQKVGDFWYSGMDSISIEKNGITPLKSYLDRINSIQSKDDLIKMIASMHKITTTALFDEGVDADQKNSLMNILTMTQGGLGLPDRDYYFRADEKTKDIRKAYSDYITKIFSLSGSNSNDATAAATTILNIETELAKSSMTLVEQRDPYA